MKVMQTYEIVFVLNCCERRQKIILKGEVDSYLVKEWINSEKVNDLYSSSHSKYVLETFIRYPSCLDWFALSYVMLYFDFMIACQQKLYQNSILRTISHNFIVSCLVITGIIIYGNSFIFCKVSTEFESRTVSEVITLKFLRSIPNDHH